MMAIPRIGHEVIVSFLNGNPDQPIVTGRTYHASSMTLQTSLFMYVLAEHKTKVFIRSEHYLPVYIVLMMKVYKQVIIAAQSLISLYLRVIENGNIHTN